MVYCVLVALLVATCTNGVLFGSECKDSTAATQFHTWIGHGVTVGNVNLGWTEPAKVGDQFTDMVAPVWYLGEVPMITWMPYPYKTWAAPTPNDDIASGQYDDYLAVFFGNLTAFLKGPDGLIGTIDDRRAYLRFAPQGNGNWYPWSPQCPSCGSTGQHINQTAASYVKMWSYVQSVAAKQGYGATDVQWVWSANSEDAADGSVTMEQIFPEGANWVAVDGLNWGTTLPGHKWQSAQEIFDSALSRCRKLAAGKSLPVGISTYGSTSDTNGVTGKDTWLNDSWQYFQRENVTMVVLYNVDTSTDFAVLGGANGDTPWVDPTTGVTLKAYTSVPIDVNTTSAVVTRNVTNPRVLSDLQFTTGHW